MAVLDLRNMTIKSEKVAARLRAYLFNISKYSHFDQGMKLRVFVTSDGDFTAFEAVEYKIGFTSSDHKMMETIASQYAPIEVDYLALTRHVDWWMRERGVVYG